MPLPKSPSRPATILPAGPGATVTKTKKPAATKAAVKKAKLPEAVAPIKEAQANKSTKTRTSPTQALPAKKETPKFEASKSSSTKSSSTSSNKLRLFVLDTNVLMHDPSCLFRFHEHDVFLPMITLEELDDHKRGMTEVARNARQVSRSLDDLVLNQQNIEDGILLKQVGDKKEHGRLFFQTHPINSDLPQVLPQGKADNQILGVVSSLHNTRTDREVVLVSKDINMRIKARALGLLAEDYRNDQVLEDSDVLYSGILALPENFWDQHAKKMESWQENGYSFYRIQGPLCEQFHVNQFVYLEGSLPLYALVKEVDGQKAVLQTLHDHGHQKNHVWGVCARNREQNFALNMLMDPDCEFVSLLGQAGTGKTLLTLAAALTQVMETKLYNEIIITRATVPVGDDIGFLPGTEEEKMLPWMGALEDNLEVLNLGGQHAGGEWGRAASMDLLRSRIKIKSLNFMRGRTFLNKFLIIDEAQNLTPKQMKTLITRAGPGTKVVCLGNIAQIDTPYLTETSSGLTYVVERFKGWPHSGHITLQRGERSRLADFAADVL